MQVTVGNLLLPRRFHVKKSPDFSRINTAHQAKSVPALDSISLKQ